jgi:hypothetical protein
VYLCHHEHISIGIGIARHAILNPELRP